LRAATLAGGTDGNGSVSVFGVECRAADRQLGDLIRVDVRRLGAHVPGIHDDSAVQSYLHATVRLSAATRIPPDDAAVGLRVEAAVLVLAKHAAAPDNAHAGHDLDELGRVAALSGKRGQHVLVEGRP